MIDYLDRDVTTVECPNCHYRGYLDHDCCLCAGIGYVKVDRLCPESLADALTCGVFFGSASAWLFPGLYCIEDRARWWIVTEDRYVQQIIEDRDLRTARWWIVTEDRYVQQISDERINRLWLESHPPVKTDSVRRWFQRCWDWMVKHGI